MAHFKPLSCLPLKTRLLAILAALLQLASCSVTYQFDPIEAWVIDAVTRNPIEGVVVTANWELVTGGLDGPRYYGQLDVRETVTDKNGRFYFAGFSKTDSSGAELRDSDPQILIFKAGYQFQRFTSDRPNGFDWGISRRSAAINGKTIQLRVLPTDKSTIRQFHSELVNSRLSFLTKMTPTSNEAKNCYWLNIPRMLLETKAHEEILKGLGIDYSSAYLDLVANSDHYVAKAGANCLSPKDLFGGATK